jgi:hypothetical protein
MPSVGSRLLQRTMFDPNAMHDTRFDSRLHVEAADAELVRGKIANFRLSGVEKDAMIQRWQKKGT